ncbi:MAG: glycosyltransferase family 39 protein [Flavobacteriaceae bacterium]|nr:glycosyltransferase family 39 protein [Flavobacteriaceae bacterium]
MILLRKPKYQFVFFLILFFVINLLQSYYTRLLGDEAYYWVWSKNLDFGYFDHPPLVAIWIKISSFFFTGELGVRFFSTISFTIMLVFIWLVIDVPKKWNYVWLFFLLVISMALLNAYGFITTPDTPLLLFVSLFLLAYKHFLKRKNLSNILFLGFSMAAMLYSKYQGVLVIFFVVISNLSLLKNKRFWLAALFGLILFFPHLYWQYTNDFTSFRYHLFDRHKTLYKISNNYLYIINLFVIVGLTFPIVYFAFFKIKIKSLFDRALKFIVFGFIIVFFFSSFSSKTQAQWNSVILIPLIILTFGYFIDHKNARKWIVVLGTIQLILLFVSRLFLINANLSPVQLEPHLSKLWVEPLKNKTDGKPLVFVNSYQNASLYKFYTGINTHSYSVLKGRKSQYNLKGHEASIQEENVFVVGSLMDTKEPLVKSNKNFIYEYEIQNYFSFENVKCLIAQNELILKPGSNEKITFEFVNTYNKKITFENVYFVGVFQDMKNKILKKIPLNIKVLKPINGKEKIFLEANFIVPKIEINENTTFRIALQFYDLLEGFQGNKVKVKKR